MDIYIGIPIRGVPLADPHKGVSFADPYKGILILKSSKTK